MGFDLQAAANITNTPITAKGANWKQIAVNTLINAAVGALVGRKVFNQTYLKGAVQGAAVTLVKAAITAVFAGTRLYQSEYATAGGIAGAAFGLTYLKEPTLPNFRQNVIHAAAIPVFTNTITRVLSHIFGESAKI